MARTENGARVLRLSRRGARADALSRRGALSLALAAGGALTAPALIGAPAAAQRRLIPNWRVAVGESRISFTYSEDGAPAMGRFERFSGEGFFEEGQPERAQLRLEIETGSIRLSDALRTDFVQGEAWFNTRRFRVARYDLASMTVISGARHRTTGDLTIKDVTRSITSELTLEIEGDRARARGSLAFGRSDFRLGDRSTALFVDIGDGVSVDFDLRARRV